MKQIREAAHILLFGLRDAHAELIRAGLQAIGAVVDVARHGGHGRCLVRRNPYDAVLLKLRPRACWAELEFCRQYGDGAGILAMLPTPDRGSPDVNELIHVANHGADDWVIDSATVEEVRARLCALAQRVAGRRQHPAIIRIHDLQIDTLRRSVRRGERDVALTAREYALLQLLARHRGTVVSHVELEEELYGGPTGTHSNVIAVYVRRLRRKLDDGSAVPLLLNRWGQGYLLRA
jgi:DNA-binding response OmpR family regulator